MIRLPLALVAALMAAASAWAQAVDIRSITPVVNISVPGSAFNLSSGVASVTSASAINATLKSNRGWDFSVHASSPTFTHTPAAGAPSTSKPVSELLIRQNGSGSFVPISTSSVVISSGPKGSDNTVSFDLRFDTTLNDSPGDYSVVLVFTLVTL